MTLLDGHTPDRRGLSERLRAVADDAANDADVPSDLLGEYLQILAAAAVGGRRPAEHELAAVRQLGMRAAERGVDAGAAVDLYLAAAARLWQAVADDVPEHRSPAAVSAAAEMVLRVVNAAVAALVEGHQDARRQMVREEEAARSRFVDDLLRGDADVARLVERAEPFGVDLARAHEVVLGAPTTTTSLERAAVLMERFIVDRIGDREVLVATKDDLLVMIVPARASLAGAGRDPGEIAAFLHTELARRMPNETWQVAAGRAFTGAYGVARSYEEARETLLLARRLGLQERVVDQRDLLAFRVLGRDQGALVDLVKGLLAPLSTARGGAEPLLLTLQTFLASGGVATATARSLHLSVRTVTYRLARIRQLTGYDPLDVGNRLALHMAVMGARLLDWPRIDLPHAGTD